VYINTNTSVTTYESINNRDFYTPSGPTNFPVVLFNNTSNNVVLIPTAVTFTVNMNGAVDEYGYPFVPGNPGFDAVFINGDWLGWYSWTAPAPNSTLPYSQYQLTENPIGSGIYSNTVTVPAGNPLKLTYKYGIYHNTGSANTNLDNEAGFAQNHVRYVRNMGNYTMPTDIFGQQRTNEAAATESSFGNLAVGTPSGGRIPVSWQGQPWVYLQTKTNLASGQWQTHYETTNLLSPINFGLSLTNWPMSGKGLFFRLINP